MVLSRGCALPGGLLLLIRFDVTRSTRARVPRLLSLPLSSVRPDFPCERSPDTRSFPPESGDISPRYFMDRTSLTDGTDDLTVCNACVRANGRGAGIYVRAIFIIVVSRRDV